jgi:hypothetical protein
MAGMEYSLKGDRAKYRPDASDRSFIVWIAIFAIALILVSVTLGVGIDPDVVILVSP